LFDHAHEANGQVVRAIAANPEVGPVALAIFESGTVVAQAKMFHRGGVNVFASNPWQQP